MRIIEETTSVIKIKDNQLLIPAIGALFIILGLAFLILDFPNDFLKNIFFTLIFVVTGALFIISYKSTIVTIDKNRGKIIFVDKGIYKKSSKELNLNNLIKIQLRNVSQIPSKEVYQLYFVFNDGQKMTPGIYTKGPTVTAPFINYKNDILIGQKLSKFLNVPLESYYPKLSPEGLQQVQQEIKATNNRVK